MTIIFAMISLAVDYGRMQLIKTEMQRCADVTARGALQMYVNDGSSIAAVVAPIIATNTFNPVDANSGVPPTITVTWGIWNTASNTFVANGTGTPMAVQVTVSRSVQNGNPVPLTFPLMSGFSGIRTTCDVWATATAVLPPSSTTTTTVNATADLWLSGMPAGSSAGFSDNPSNAAPAAVVMQLIPGTTITVAATGLTMYKGPVGTIGPDGGSTNTSHMSGSPDGDYNGLQNGIQSITAPQDALIGVFLTAAQPNTVTPPSTALDYSTSGAKDENTYSSLQVQQPFFIGDGKTSGGTTQSFVVPAGATRLYLGVFDGWQNWDNPGSLSVKTTQQAQIYLVK